MRIRPLSMLQWSVQHRGLAGTMRAAIRRLIPPTASVAPVPHPFDVEFGTDTGGLISGGRLATGSSNDVYNSAYFGIAPSRLHAGIHQWTQSIAPGKLTDYTFIDLGAGKGRALMIASEHPFHHVIGIELNQELAQIATANLEIWKKSHRAQCPVDVLCQDAATLSLPDRPCVLYLYNPFAAAVMRQVIERVKAQVMNRRHPLSVLYFNPVAEEVFVEYPRFLLLWSGSLTLSPDDQAADTISTPNEKCSIYCLT